MRSPVRQRGEGGNRGVGGNQQHGGHRGGPRPRWVRQEWGTTRGGRRAIRRRTAWSRAQNKRRRLSFCDPRPRPGELLAFRGGVALRGFRSAPLAAAIPACLDDPANVRARREEVAHSTAMTDRQTHGARPLIRARCGAQQTPARTIFFFCSRPDASPRRSRRVPERCVALMRKKETENETCLFCHPSDLFF